MAGAGNDERRDRGVGGELSGAGGRIEAFEIFSLPRDLSLTAFTQSSRGNWRSGTKLKYNARHV